MQLAPVPSHRLPPNEKMGTAMNDREFSKHLQEIAQGKARQDRPPVQEPPQERQRQTQRELPAKKVPDKAKLQQWENRRIEGEAQGVIADFPIIPHRAVGGLSKNFSGLAAIKYRVQQESLCRPAKQRQHHRSESLVFSFSLESGTLGARSARARPRFDGL